MTQSKWSQPTGSRPTIKQTSLTGTHGMLFWAFLIVVLLSPLTLPATDATERVTIPLPPASLGAWYKPQNKRQAWLHLMFRLEQTSQAVSTYANQGEIEPATRWVGELAKSYRKIPQMVPQWGSEVDEEALMALEKAAEQNDLTAMQAAMKKIRQTCKSCHGNYKAAAIALYRSADFNSVKMVGEADQKEWGYSDLMKALRRDLTALKIAREDGNPDQARSFGVQLGQKLTTLGQSCTNCHQDDYPKERILGAPTQQTLAALQEALKEPGKTKKSGHLLGVLGVTVCGRCHGIHRNSWDLKQLLKE
ncbi:MAG: cytochrome c [Magnetococcales bacterium]|nr:cytochrome c [Magnetococcales bacterium]